MSNEILTLNGANGAPQNSTAHGGYSTNGAHYHPNPANGTPLDAPPTNNGTDARAGYPDAAPSTRPVYLLPHHEQTLTAIAPDVIAERGYRTELTPSVLASYGYTTKNGKPPKWVKECIPALLIPVWNAAGEDSLVQIRPDNPRFKANGKPIKYETPPGFKMCVDVHPRIRKQIADPSIDLWITEGVKDSDTATSRGLCCVALLGVWNWRGANDLGGATVLPDWEHFAFKAKDGTARRVYIAFDSDVSRKPEVAAALKRFVVWLEFRGAKVVVVVLAEGADGEKTGLQEFFERGATVDDLRALADVGTSKTSVPIPEAKILSPDEIRVRFKDGCAKIAPPCSLDDVKAVYRRWLYLRDESLVEVTIAATVANLMDGDPAWLMIVGGSSSGKTEVVNPLAALPFTHLVGVLTEAAFLSGSSKRDHDSDSTGGLLREVGDFGILILKDFTSILSIHHDKRMAILAALREIYDGSWSKRGGNDGGKNQEWKGKCGVVACCTDALESASAVTNAMGERFMRYRWQHTEHDQNQIARLAMRRGGSDAAMRTEMQNAVCGYFGGLTIPASPPQIDEATEDALIALATFTARGRSVVDRDGKTREIELIHDSEVPARFGVMLRRMYAALRLIGVPEARTWKILEKIALDSMPKLRGQIVAFLRAEHAAGHPKKLASHISAEVKSANSSTRRALEELRAHSLLAFTEEEAEKGTAYFWGFSDFALELLETGFGSVSEKSDTAERKDETKKIAQKAASSFSQIKINIFTPTVPDDLSETLVSDDVPTGTDEAAGVDEF